MGVLRRQREDGARLQYLAFRGIKLFPHGVPKAATHHGDDLSIGMSVRRNFIIWREFHPLDDRLGLCWVTDLDGGLHAAPEDRMLYPRQPIGLDHLHRILSHRRTCQRDQSGGDTGLVHPNLLPNVAELEGPIGYSKNSD